MSGTSDELTLVRMYDKAHHDFMAQGLARLLGLSPKDEATCKRPGNSADEAMPQQPAPYSPR